MSNIGLVAFDLDGTLLNGTGSVSAQSIDTLDRLLDAGIIVASISGRNVHKSQAPFEKGLGCRLFVGSYNGAVVLGATVEGGRELLFEQRLSPEEFDALTNYISDRQINFVYCGFEMEGQAITEAYTTDRDSESIRNLHRLTGTEFVYDSNLSERLKKGELGPSPKLILMPGNDLRDEVLAELSDDFRDRLYIARTGDDRIEVMHPGVNKAVALQAICSACGVEMEDTLAIGDGDNDLPMLMEAGVGILMSNADEETRGIATGAGVNLCPSLEDEGFSAAVEQYVFN
jgi:hypothetical protein